METPQLLPNVDFNIAYKLPTIEFDQQAFNNEIEKVLAPVKFEGDKKLDEKTLKTTLANLRKFQKQISDRRIEIVKQIKQPITDFEAIIKNGDAAIEAYINKYNAELKALEAKEKVAKQIQIEKLLSEIILTHKLDQAHAPLLIIMNEYYLAKWSMSKIKEDLNSRAKLIFALQDQKRLHKELEKAKIEKRIKRIEELNAETGFKWSYADFPIEQFDDEQLNLFYYTKSQERKEMPGIIIVQEDIETEEISSSEPEHHSKRFIIEYTESAVSDEEMFHEIKAHNKANSPEAIIQTANSEINNTGPDYSISVKFFNKKHNLKTMQYLIEQFAIHWGLTYEINNN